MAKSPSEIIREAALSGTITAQGRRGAALRNVRQAPRAPLLKRIKSEFKKTLGLQSYGWGRYGSDHHVRFVKENGRLVPFGHTQTIKTPDVPSDKFTFKRTELPQIKSTKIPEFLEHCQNCNVKYAKESVHPADLTPTQSEFDGEKVKQMTNRGFDPHSFPAIASNDGYILDGHHRWLSTYNDGGKMSVMKIDLPIKKLIEFAKRWSGVGYKKLDEAVLVEGVFDKANFKVIFMAGGSGAGKDFVKSRTLEGFGLREINSDQAFEMFLKKTGTSFKMGQMSQSEYDKTSELRDAAKRTTQKKMEIQTDERLGLIINGTGSDSGRIKELKTELEKLGYESLMMFVHVSDETSQTRNKLRGERGGREVPEKVRKEKWEESNANRSLYKKMFGDHFIQVDADKDGLDPANKAEVDTIHLNVYRHVKRFIDDPVTNEAARKWYQYKAEREHVNFKDKIHKRFEDHAKDKVAKSLNNPAVIDYNRMSNYSLAQRSRYGDRKAAELLMQRERQKEQQQQSQQHHAV